MTNCPCCGQHLPDTSRPLWDKERRRLHFNGETIWLSLHQAALFDHLFKFAPQLCTNEFLRMKIWGLMEVDAEIGLRVLTCKLKKRLEPMGIQLENTWGSGYSLEWKEENAH